MSRVPSLFVSHGAPTLAIEQTAAHRFLQELGRDFGTEFPKPKAILAVSAHWETSVPTVSLAEHPATIHDFGGFGPELERMQYPAPGAPDIARQVVDLLWDADIPAATHPTRGLDHGAWVPLHLMLPDAQTPVFQLSVQSHIGGRAGAEHAWHVGQALAPLGSQGILVLGSGSITHDLRSLFRGHPGDGADTRSDAFIDWMSTALADNRLEDLLDWRDKAPYARQNHPTEEHFLPLLTALGAGSGPAKRLHHSVEYRALGMDAYAFGQRPLA